MTRVRDDRNVITELWVVQIVLNVIALLMFGLFRLIPLVGWIIGGVVAGLIGLGSYIYSIVYIYQAVKDINIVCAKTEGNDVENSWNYIVVCLVGFITGGAYIVYWYYKQGGRLHKALKVYGIDSEDTGVSYLLWLTVGFLLKGNAIACYLLIKNLNKAARAYNEGGPKSSVTPPVVQPPVIPTPPTPPEVDPHTQKAAMLVGIKGQYAGQQIPITGNDLIVMGRDGSQANLIFRSEKISKAHCKVQFMPNENCFYVVDTSTYGVFLENGKRLEKGKISKLPRGTKIVLGGTEVFQLK